MNKKLLILLSLFVTLLFSAGSLYAYEAADIQINCTPTPDVDVRASIPKSGIVKTNNLRRKTGAGVSAFGKFIVVTGRVFGQNCLPIENAAVEIWQADSNGKTGDEMDKNFTGSGLTYTNNVGEFSFLTVMPQSSSSDSAPHINFKIYHSDIGEKYTSMYFPELKENLDDATLKTLEDVSKDLVTSIKSVSGNSETYSFDITLQGSSKHARF